MTWKSPSHSRAAAENTTPSIVGVIALAVLLTGVSVTAYEKPSRDYLKRMCGSPDYECVKVTAGIHSWRIITHLDFARDTPADILRQIPQWFGNQKRPVGLQLDGKLLEEDVSLGDQGIQITSPLMLVSVNPRPSSTSDKQDEYTADL